MDSGTKSGALELTRASTGPYVPNGDANSVTADLQLKDRRKLKWRIYISVFMMCWGTLISFAGTTAIETIQSSLNTAEGLGTASLAVKMASMVVQSLFFNSFCFKKLGLKGAMIVGIGLELIYTGANFYPTWWTMIPGAIISGLGKPMERTAEATYLSRISRLYVDKVLDRPGAASDVVKTRFFNIYYVFYMASRVVGNVASSLILGSGLQHFSLTRLLSPNGENNSSNVTALFCGANFCDQVANSSSLLKRGREASSVLGRVNDNRVYQLCGFSIGSFVVAIVILIVFLVKIEDLQKVGLPAKTGNGEAEVTADDSIDVDPETRVVTKPWALLLDTVRQWRKLNQLLLIPLTVYNGMDNTFFSADFTKSFVTCPFGIHWVGFTAAWYGITSPLAVFLCGGLAKPSLRPIPFIVALTCHIGSGITMLYLTQFTLVNSFILSAVWGIGSGLWPYTLSALYGIVFETEPEAAYSNYWLLDSFGATVNYSWSHYLCTETKLYALMIILGCSFLGYTIVEYRFRKQQQSATTTKIVPNTNNEQSSTKL